MSQGRLLATCAVFALSSCLVIREPSPLGEDSRCASCHGRPDAPGDALAKAAPPRDTLGNDAVTAPGVGAHQAHLESSETHEPVACTACHLVPLRTESPGHADTAGPAEVVFGELARQGGRAPRYDFVRLRCSDAYCHGPRTQAWTRPRSSAEACGSCHGLPPAPPHPQSTRCELCHGEVAGPGGTIVAPALHVDGTLQLSQAGCGACHGDAAAGAPPPSLDGGTSREHLGVGAHATHLAGSKTSRAVRCDECHLVPTTPEAPGHLNGGAAEVRFSGAALGPADGGAAYAGQGGGATCSTWCHAVGRVGVASPAWTSTGPALACAGCHGMPPPAPHARWANCAACHSNATGASGQELKDAGVHVNGAIESAMPSSCDGCHGSSVNSAPPRDTRGNDSTSLASVGAHQAHLLRTGIARRTLCEDCHSVPAVVVTAEHPDGLTQVAFSGLATRAGANPSYSAGGCSNTYCHDTRVLNGGQSTGGLAQTPSWTRLDGTQVQCDSCHGYPPPAGHPQRLDCATCHPTAGAANQVLLPDRHVDGVLDLK